MGLRGPPPLPTAERKARGTFQPSRDRAAGVATTTPGEPPMPDDMPEAAQKLWRWHAPRLVAAGVLDERDGGALERYCREYARWRELQLDAVTMPRVGPKANPAGAEARKLAKEVLEPLEIALGLHYAARSRMRKPQTGDAADPVEDEFFGPLRSVEGGKPA